MTRPVTWIGIRAAARRLNIHENTVRRMCEDGRLDCRTKPGGDSRQVNAASVERLLDHGDRLTAYTVEQLHAATDFLTEILMLAAGRPFGVVSATQDVVRQVHACKNDIKLELARREEP